MSNTKCVTNTQQSAVGLCLGDQQTAVELIVPTILRDPHSSTCYWAARLDYLMVPSQLEKWGSWEQKRE